MEPLNQNTETEFNYNAAYDYETERFMRQKETVSAIIAEGNSVNSLDVVFPIQEVMTPPTFLTTPEENPQLAEMLLARNQLLAPTDDKESPQRIAASKLYAREQRESFSESGLIFDKSMDLVAASGLYKDGIMSKEAAEPLNADAQKAYDWYKHTRAVLDPKQAKSVSNWKGVTKFSGLVADLAVMSKAIGTNSASMGEAVLSGNSKLAEGVVNKQLAKGFTKLFKNTNLIKNRGIMNVTAQLAEDVQMGVGFALRDVAMNSEDFTNSTKTDTASRIAHEFGTGFLIDMGINTLTNVIVPAGKYYKNIFFSPSKGTKLGKASKNVADYEQVLGDIVKFDIDENSVKKLREMGLEEAADNLETSRSQIKKILTMSDAGDKTNAISKAYANAMNMDITEVAGGYDVVMNTLAKKVKTVSVANIEDALKLVDDQMVGLLKRSDSLSKTLASTSRNIKITRLYDSKTTSKIDLDDLSETILPHQGVFNKDNIKQAETFVKKAVDDLSEAKLMATKEITAEVSPNFFKEIPSVQSSVLKVPSKINNSAQQKEYLSYVSRFIDNHGVGIDTKKLDDLFEHFSSLAGRWNVQDLDWISNQAARNNKVVKQVNGGFILDGGEGSQIGFKSQEQLGTYVLGETITPDEYATYLKTEKGYNIASDDEIGLLKVLDKVGNRVASGKDITEIMTNNPMLRPKYPLRSGPKLVFSNDNLQAVRFEGDSIMGSAAQIENYMAKFEDYGAKSSLNKQVKSKRFTKANGTDVYMDTNGKRWRVESPNTGMKTKYFKSEKALKKYLGTIGTPEKEMLVAARDKGTQVIANRNGYIIQKAGTPDQHFRTFEDAQKYIKNLPSPINTAEVFDEVAGEISFSKKLFGDKFGIDMDNQTMDSGMAALKKLSADTLVKRGKRSKSPLMEKFQDLISPIRSKRGVVYSMTSGKANIEGLNKKLNDVVEVEKIVNTSEAYMKQTLDDLSKLVAPEEREILGNILSKELDPSDWGFAYNKMTGGTLSSDGESFMTSMRSTYDELATVNGFDHSLDRIENYFPRLKTLTASDYYGENASAIQLVEKAFGRELHPAEMKFFENMRTVDIAAYTTQNDPLVVLNKYYTDTLRSKYLEPALDNLTDFAKSIELSENGQKIINDVAKQGRGLNEDIMTENLKRFTDELKHTGAGYLAGIDKEILQAGLTQEVVQNLSPLVQEKLLKSLATFKPRQNPLNKLFGVVTASTQAFKGWMPIRNTFQPETHLAPLFTFDAIKIAKKQVGELSNEGWDYLGRNSIFQSKTPQAAADVMGSGVIEKFNEVGLKSYKSSDNFDRAVGFMVIHNQMEDGLKAMKNYGDKGADFFMNTTKLYTAPEHIQSTVLDYIGKGDVEMATISYAQWMNSMVFLDYSSLVRPSAFNSLSGKVFGQMGTFATQTVESRAYFLKNLTKLDTAAYTVRAVGGAYALNRAWSEITGSEVNNFSVYGSMMFTGGPLLETAYSALNLLGSSDYKRDQAKASLGQQMTSVFTPIKTASNIIGGGGELLQGNIHKGAVQIMNAPGKGKDL